MREAGGKGWGLFANEEINEGSFIVEYVGEVISMRELSTRKIRARQNQHLYFLIIPSSEVRDVSVHVI